jgi:hypothetical protein
MIRSSPRNSTPASHLANRYWLSYYVRVKRM